MLQQFNNLIFPLHVTCSIQPILLLSVMLSILYILHCCLTLQWTTKVMLRQSVNLITCFLDRLTPKRLTSLSPVTDNCPTWTIDRERMAVEMILWPTSKKECCQTGGSNPQPPEYQLKAHPTELPGPTHDIKIWLSKPVRDGPDINFKYGSHTQNEPCHWENCLCHMQTTKAQISLRIRAVWSAPLLFAA